MSESNEQRWLRLYREACGKPGVLPNHDSPMWAFAAAVERDVLSRRPVPEAAPGGLSEEEKAGMATIKEMLDETTPGQWDWSNFSKADGSPIESVEDVAETLAVSARKGPGAYLKGVSAKDDLGDLVVCYTGNGPRAEANSKLLAHAPDAIRYLMGIISRLLPTPAPNREAELKVIEAAKAWRAQKLKPEFNDKEDERIVGILHDALASLAQDEMKGEQ